jgi:hypothetical protein
VEEKYRPQPFTHFSMLHAEKREGLGGEITRALLRNCFVQQGIEPYTNRSSKQSNESPSDSICYRFIGMVELCMDVCLHHERFSWSLPLLLSWQHRTQGHRVFTKFLHTLGVIFASRTLYLTWRLVWKAKYRLGMVFKICYVRFYRISSKNSAWKY